MSVPRAKEGVLERKGTGIITRGWQKRWFRLAEADNSIQISKTAASPVLETVSLKGTTVNVLADNHGLVFTLTQHPKSTLQLRAGSREEVASWTAAIRNTQRRPIEKLLEASDMAKDLAIDSSEITFDSDALAGSGASGVVRIGEYRGIMVAVKSQLCVEPSLDGRGTAAPAEYVKELELQASFRHPNIVQLIGYYFSEPPASAAGQLDTPSTYSMVMELMPLGSLRSHIQRHGMLEPHFLLCVALDLARGMVYLHAANVMHRDIKAENVLLATESSIVPHIGVCAKLCDFGIARNDAMADKNVTQTFAATLPYAAPEMYGKEGYSRSVDVYAFGVLLWIMATGLEPWADVDQFQLPVKVMAGERPEWPDDVSPALRELGSLCWAQSAADRPTFRDIQERVLGMLNAYEQDRPDTPVGPLQLPVESNAPRKYSAAELNVAALPPPLNITVNDDPELPDAEAAAAAPTVIGFDAIVSSLGGSSMPFEKFQAVLDEVLNAAAHLTAPTKLLFVSRATGHVDVASLKRFYVCFDGLLREPGDAGKYAESGTTQADSLDAGAEPTSAEDPYAAAEDPYAAAEDPYAAAAKFDLPPADMRYLSNIARLARAPWFHGFLRRDESERLLRACAAETFVVRFSLRQRQYVVSVRSTNGFVHAVMEREGSGAFVATDTTFASVEDVVAFFVTTGTTYTHSASGAPLRLKTPRAKSS